MKNSYIALAVFSMAALLVSCETVNEVQNDTFVPTENDVVFNLGYNRIQTKASDADAPVAKVTTFDLGRDGENSFFLEQSVVSLDGYAAGPETKGTPAYTENLGVLYDKLGVFISGGSFPTSETEFAKHSDTQIKDSGWQYYKNYGYNPWPSSANQAVDIYVRMPYDDGVNISSRTGGKFTFSYTSPESAANQKDILFGYRSVTRSEYEASLPTGLPMLLNHALTGVKFAAGNVDKDGNPADVTIKSIKIEGLYNSGTCVVTPNKETDYKDVTSNYSSSKDGVVVWTPTPASAPSTGTFTNTYTGTVNFSTSTTTTNEDGETVTTPGKFANNGNYPDSFAATGGKNNLNDADATQTFWFIPQDFGTDEEWRDVTLTVTYSLMGSNTNEAPLVINFGELLAKRGVEWKAGELYTYTLRIDEVNVRIEDNVQAGNNGAIVGSKKNAVEIYNTGNTDAFIRAAIVGQWVIKEGNETVIMFGFTDEVNKLYEVESWYQDQFGIHSDDDTREPHGLFVGLAGYQADPTGANNHDNDYNGWVYKDGYYYCKTSVAPGYPTPTPLFTSYEIKKIPHTTNTGTVLSQYMYFTLEIATQAISARTDNGTLMTNWETAWNQALAIDDDPVDKTIITDDSTNTGNGE